MMSAIALSSRRQARVVRRNGRRSRAPKIKEPNGTGADSAGKKGPLGRTGEAAAHGADEAHGIEVHVRVEEGDGEEGEGGAPGRGDAFGAVFVV